MPPRRSRPARSVVRHVGLHERAAPTCADRWWFNLDVDSEVGKEGSILFSRPEQVFSDACHSFSSHTAKADRQAHLEQREPRPHDARHDGQPMRLLTMIGRLTIAP